MTTALQNTVDSYGLLYLICTTSRILWVNGHHPKSPWLFVLKIKELHSWRDSYWQFLMAIEAWILIVIAYGKVKFVKVIIMRLITLGDSYDAKWYLLLKLIVMWYIRVTIYDYFYYWLCLIKLHQKAIHNIILSQIKRTKPSVYPYFKDYYLCFYGSSVVIYNIIQFCSWDHTVTSLTGHS